jgi:hypothetical protein
LEKASWSYSNGVRLQPHARTAIEQIPSAPCTPSPSTPHQRGADRRDNPQRAAVDRASHAHARCQGTLLPSWEHPSGRFHANGARTVIACLAHNLLRRTDVLGRPDTTARTARTLRRRLLALPGRLTRHAGRWTMLALARLAWQHDLIRALARIRALPAAARPGRTSTPPADPGPLTAATQHPTRASVETLPTPPASTTPDHAVTDVRCVAHTP